jgi:hypothetical protein
MVDDGRLAHGVQPINRVLSIATALAAGGALVIFAALTILPTDGRARPANHAYLQGGCDTAHTPFCDALTVPIPNWSGHIFHLRQDYPTKAAADAQPWTRFDPRTEPDAYLRAALSYLFEGNIRSDPEASFDPILNTKRAWYHAPWLDSGTSGREFIHGLTRERVSRPYELAPQQTHYWNNYAVGFYNALGGMILGRVWKDHANPNAAAAVFPNGTVAAKLLFTTAPVTEVPYLQGAPQWQAYVYPDPSELNPQATGPRAVLRLRLLQVDIAVKDERAADTTGWVFGTLVYGGGPGGRTGSGWTNIAPIGVMWGNDPAYSGTGPLSQTWLNPSVHMPHVGFQGRLNGPVDYPSSSCLSCHGTGEVPSGTMLPAQGVDPAPWFRNIKSGRPADAGHQSTDYSLQLAVGIANFFANRATLWRTTPEERESLLHEMEVRDERPPPDDTRRN